MASNASFDVSTGADLQEVDNAVNQALKEIAQRYDFKGAHCTIDFDRPKAEIRLSADDEYRMEALLDVLKTKMIKRGVPIKNLDLGVLQPATGQSVRRVIKLTQGIPQDVSKRMVKAIKDQIQDMVDKTLSGLLDRGAAAVCGQLLNIKLRAIEVERKVRETEEFEERLAQIEASLSERRLSS